MMDTEKIKEIGKWMMVIGGTIFTSGAGCYWVAGHIERKEEKKIHQTKLLRLMWKLKKHILRDSMRWIRRLSLSFMQTV